MLVCVFAASAVSVNAQDETRAAWQVSDYDLTVRMPQTAVAAGQLPAIEVRAVVRARNVGGAAARTFTARIAPEAEVRQVTIDNQPTASEKGTDAAAKLQTARLRLSQAVAPGGQISVTFDYRLPLERNSGLAAVSPEGAQLLPLAAWYPTPNTQFAARGIDIAPYRLAVGGAGADQLVISGGARTAEAGASVYRQTLNAQPLLLAGRYTTIAGSGATAGIDAHLYEGADAAERARAEDLIKLIGEARTFVGEALGVRITAPLRLVAVRRGAGFDGGGVMLVDAAAFRRERTDTATALALVEGVARTVIGGSLPVRGEGAGAIREGLARHLALSFIERRFGAETADAERARERAAYTTIALRDAPLSKLTPASPDYYATAAIKGSGVWRLIEATLGREAFAARMRTAFAKPDADLTLVALRAALVAGADEYARSVIDFGFDRPSETDLLVGVPVREQTAQRLALRNTGSVPVRVQIVAHTNGGAPLNQDVAIPASDFGEARFPLTANITRVEIDPQKLYPQINYDNDVAPKSSAPTTLLVDSLGALARSDNTAAEAAARNALARLPRFVEARVALARALLAANRVDDAEREFRAVIEDPLPTAAALAGANAGLGEALLRRNQAAEAARRFDFAARADAAYDVSLAARDGRLRAEAAARTAPAIDEEARRFVQTLDAAIKTGRKTEIDALLVPGELAEFARGIVSNQPTLWTSEVRRTELLGGNRIGVDVRVAARVLGKDQAGTAVYVLTRTPAGLRLADVQLFEVR